LTLRRARRRPVEVTVAVIAAAVALIGTLSTAAVEVYKTINAGSAAPYDCISTVQKYDDYVSADPSRVSALIAPSPDHTSMLDHDPAAITCHISGPALEQMAKTPNK
jgi:hypothetical protein